MNKTWGEIRKEALHLGFDREANYVKYKDSFVKAFNWAQNHVAVISSCLVAKTGFNVNVNGRSWSPGYIDMRAMAAVDDKEFLHLAQRGVLKAGTSERVESAKLVDNQYVYIDPNEATDVEIWWVYAPKPITDSTPDDYECELPDKWAKLIPYYMANRLYLEDDAQKAGYYWNLAEDMMEHILMKEREPAVSVFGGFDIDGWCI